jgi:autotransporter strand-loop-strand O-heptosyltransferase
MSDRKFIANFINGPTLEIKDSIDKEYNVKFLNQDNNRIYYKTKLKNNHWASSSFEYFINWKIIVEDLNGNLIHEHLYNAENKRVFISFESKAIGDTLAWFPYVKEFQTKHKCQVIVSTFHNSFFKEKYPELTFSDKGSIVHNIYAQYNIGWFYEKDNKINYKKNPTNFRLQPLQKACTSILGLEYKEIKPLVSFKNVGSTIEEDYVVIAPHGSAHAKYWNYPGGWQIIIDYLNSKGYKVAIITKEPLDNGWHDSKLGGTLTGVIDKTGDYSLKDRANDIMNSKAFIGIGSGLSWLSWTLNTKTILISGFSEDYSEMESCERISPTSPDICKGCYNYQRLDAGDWEWCPEHKNTFRQFECTKSILPSTVINSINQQLGIS